MTAEASASSSTHEETWQLYVDETGEFDRDVEASYVVGLLVRGRVDPSAAAAWKEAIRESFPFAPWPPHMAELNLRSFRPYCIARGLVHPLPRQVPAAYQRAVASLRKHTEFAHVLAEERPDLHRLRDVLQQSDAWLESQDPDLVSKLTRLANEERDKAVQRLRQALGACAADALLVIAAARPTTRALPTAAHTHSHDPYYDALETLLQQVMASVGAMDGAEPARVWADVAARHLSLRRPAQPGHEEHQPLSRGDLDRCVQRLRALGKAPRLREVAFNFATPRRYDAQVPPGIVAADVLANGVRHVFLRSAKRTTPLTRVIDLLNGTLRVPPQASAPRLCGGRLPSIGAAGVARGYVTAHWRGTKPTVSLDGERAQWAREAAQAWGDAFTAARQGP